MFPYIRLVVEVVPTGRGCCQNGGRGRCSWNLGNKPGEVTSMEISSSMEDGIERSHLSQQTIHCKNLQEHPLPKSTVYYTLLSAVS